MKQWFKFVAIGSFFATVEEFLTVVLLKGEIGSYIFTLVILFPVFLSIVYFTRPKSDLAHFFTYGVAGLMIEWFLIGLSPWSNPSANPILMLLFQLGMFSFWATVAFVPRLFLKAHPIARTILKFYIGYFAFVYVVAFALPREKRFGPVIILIILGFLALNGFYFRYFKTGQPRVINPAGT